MQAEQGFLLDGAGPLFQCLPSYMLEWVFDWSGISACARVRTFSEQLTTMWLSWQELSNKPAPHVRMEDLTFKTPWPESLKGLGEWKKESKERHDKCGSIRL